MFKIGLLTSSAMTAVALLLSGAPTQAQTDMHVAHRDSNARFLCNYGAQFKVYHYGHKHSGSQNSSWQHVAAPVRGRGQTVSRIIVMESQANSFRKAAFSAGIHSNSPSGFPGKLIAGGKSKAGSACAPVTIKIPSTTLTAKTKYWIVEDTAGSVVSNWRANSSFYWYYNPKARHVAYVQTHTEHCSSDIFCHSSTSPWTKQSSGPWFRLK